MADKRKEPPTPTPANASLVKRQRQNDGTAASASNALQLGSAGGAGRGAVIQAVKRTSALRAPIMELSGHNGEVFAVRFDPSGHHIASGAFDRTIRKSPPSSGVDLLTRGVVVLWNTYGDCDNYGLMEGHKGAVLDLRWSRDSRMIYTASADMNLGTWDAETGVRLRKHVGHEDIVNAVDAFRTGGETLVSGSDDGSIGLWDPRTKAAVAVYEDKYPICAVAFSQAGDQIYSGGLDEEIKVWDVRQRKVAYTLLAHGDTITSLAVSPDGTTLASNSMDNTIKLWNIQPFAPNNRLIKSLDGAPHSFEKNLHRVSWNTDGTRLGAGSGDRTVVIWDMEKESVQWKLPGHTGSVNDVSFSPIEPIIASASTDRKIILGELL
jgi:Prp8 binding protein